MNNNNMNKMRNGIVKKLIYCDKAEINQMNCIVYCERNRSKLPFKNIDARNSEILKLIYTNIRSHEV